MPHDLEEEKASDAYVDKTKINVANTRRSYKRLLLYNCPIFLAKEGKKLSSQTDVVTYCSMIALQYINCHRQSITILLLAMFHLFHWDLPCDSHPYS